MRKTWRRARVTCGAGWKTVSQVLVAVGLLGVATPAQATPPVAQPPAATRFAFGGNAAEIPAQFIGNLVFIPVRVNEGRPALFELDSTAGVSSVAPDRAADLGPNPTAPTRLDLAGVAMTFPPLPIVAKNDFAAQIGRAYEGALGQDFFAKVIVEIDYARQTVRLYDPSAYTYSGRGQSLPLNLSGGAPVISAKFGLSDGKPVEGNFVVNTALDASVSISDRYLAAHRLHTPRTKTFPDAPDQAASVRDMALGRIKLFKIGPYSVDSPIAQFSTGEAGPKSEARIAGEIGAGMLRRFTVTFDFPHQRIIFDANSNLREEDRGDMSGLFVIAAGPGLKRLEVAAVWPGGPAADAGVHPGDVIAGVDDEPAADFSLAQLRTLFSEPARQHKLLLERKGQTVEVTIRMRRLL